jgi:D-psicose/D-tagatose/L-ribulose 3-epimerase
VPLEQILEKFVQFGFDGIDIPGEKDTFPVAKIKPLLDSYSNKLQIGELTACINPTRDLIHPDDKKRQHAIDYIKYCIDAAQALECNKTHFCFITFPENLNGSPREKLEKTAIRVIAELAKYAANKEVTLMMEPLFKDDTSLVNRADQAISLFSKALNMDPVSFLKEKHQFGLLLDIFHMHHEEQDSLATIEKYLPKTYHMHVADHPRGLNFARSDSNFVAKAMQKLRSMNYDHFLSFESFDPDWNLDRLENALHVLKSL